MIAVAYIRVSTDEQHLGPEAQRASIEKWASANGHTIASWREDIGISGGAPLDKRLGLMAAIDSLEAGMVLVVAKRDRLARDVMLAAMIARLVEKADATIHSADGAGNGEGPEAEMMRGILDVFAQYERALIRARTRTALAAKKARGERTGTIPTGKALVDGKIVDGPEAATVARARALRAEGLSFKAISDRLVVEGHRKFWKGTIHRICKGAA